MVQGCQMKGKNFRWRTLNRSPVMLLHMQPQKMPNEGEELQMAHVEPVTSYVTSHATSRDACKVKRSALNNVETRTTLMLRNLPLDYTRDMLLQLLDKEGFAGKYDFIYLPVDFKTRAGLGYAFLNMVRATDA